MNMNIHRRVPLVFRPHLELSEPQNCTQLEIDVEPTEVYSSFIYLACAIVVVLHIKHHSAVGSTVLFGLVASAVGLALTPFLLVVCAIFTIYRYAAKKQLEKESGYMGLMEGSDAYWAGEQDYARSVINILCMVDFSMLPNPDRKPIDAMRDVLGRIVGSDASFKLNCKKKMSKFGYYYLEKCGVNLDENVRYIEQNLETKKDLEWFASEIANEPIIRESFWEVLVGREPVSGSYPVMFRVHHALGDGYALVQLFLDFMTDKDGKSRKFVRKESVLMRLVNGEYNKHFIHTFTSIINKIFVYLYALVVMAEQLFTPPDRNSLHNRIYLSGKKICRWTQVDLIKIKEIRRSLKCRFTDVVLTVLSNSLEGCFVNWGEKIDQVRLVLPARLPGSSSGMSNLFTVAMLELPLTGKGKFEKIVKTSERLRKLPDFLVNYWLLRVAFTIFPASFMAKMVTSLQSTIAISNVPGPKEMTKLAGCNVTDLVFFLPNRDTTGVGISMLSYADKFNIGITVDSSLVTRTEQADEILEGISLSIEQLHRSVVPLR
ncbi:Hypothetical protein NTJ_15859 [Nesidiocoris tenuis]|uniref:O-acyltransferase WSD1 C-terminal domain-containing protein n=1 Tax=Nesidiocoris tenuis TaxID=355587 RepID=A0ABN7BF88_9HEMI|nr:Hypothetical protein NTJ_15859 [Nesidiocoris tenuis]